MFGVNVVRPTPYDVTSAVATRLAERGPVRRGPSPVHWCAEIRSWLLVRLWTGSEGCWIIYGGLVGVRLCVFMQHRSCILVVWVHSL